LFDEERDPSIYLMLDVSRSMVEPAKFDMARRIAAALCYVGLRTSIASRSFPETISAANRRRAAERVESSGCSRPSNSSKLQVRPTSAACKAFARGRASSGWSSSSPTSSSRALLDG
jgi:uncharacterized protein (DUF58 family)